LSQVVGDIIERVESIEMREHADRCGWFSIPLAGSGCPVISAERLSLNRSALFVVQREVGCFKQVECRTCLRGNE